MPEDARVDVVVAGLGVAGASTALALAERGASVLGLDAHAPPHPLGSSQGSTRITRLAVGEGDAYVALVARSHERWRQLEVQQGTELFVDCGMLVLGGSARASHHGRRDFASATRAVADRHGIAYEMLAPHEVTERHPALAAPDRDAFFEPTAGYLRAEACVTALLAAARAAGAQLATDEPVVAVSAVRGGVEVTTTRRRVRAGRLVACVGPWLGELFEELAGVATVERQVAHWLSIRSGHDALAALPVYLWLHSERDDAWFYGFPALDGPTGGVKVATERFGRPTTAARLERRVDPAEAASLWREHVSGRVLGVGPEAVRSVACPYTVTRDFGFVLDVLGSNPAVVVCSACSGHGFKHAPAVGECAAALALGEPTPFDVGAFSLRRLG